MRSGSARARRPVDVPISAPPFEDRHSVGHNHRTESGVVDTQRWSKASHVAHGFARPGATRSTHVGMGQRTPGSGTLTVVRVSSRERHLVPCSGRSTERYALDAAGPLKFLLSPTISVLRNEHGGRPDLVARRSTTAVFVEVLRSD